MGFPNSSHSAHTTQRCSPEYQSRKPSLRGRTLKLTCHMHGEPSNLCVPPLWRHPLQTPNASALQLSTCPPPLSFLLSPSLFAPLPDPTPPPPHTRHLQVDHFIMGSPFNIIALLTWWLPGGMRVKKAPKVFAPWAQNCLDGFVPATPHSLVLPSGRYEIPHLVYQLTLVPLMIAVSTAGFFLHLPICVGYFGVVVRSGPAGATRGECGLRVRCGPRAVSEVWCPSWGGWWRPLGRLVTTPGAVGDDPRGGRWWRPLGRHRVVLGVVLAWSWHAWGTLGEAWSGCVIFWSGGESGSWSERGSERRPALCRWQDSGVVGGSGAHQRRYHTAISRADQASAGGKAAERCCGQNRPRL
eukprot:365556-Chlamydomonas_euryale.AAC.3